MDEEATLLFISSDYFLHRHRQQDHPRMTAMYTKLFDFAIWPRAQITEGTGDRAKYDSRPIDSQLPSLLDILVDASWVPIRSYLLLNRTSPLSVSAMNSIQSRITVHCQLSNTMKRHHAYIPLSFFFILHHEWLPLPLLALPLSSHFTLLPLMIHKRSTKTTLRFFAVGRFCSSGEMTLRTWRWLYPVFDSVVACAIARRLYRNHISGWSSRSIGKRYVSSDDFFFIQENHNLDKTSLGHLVLWMPFEIKWRREEKKKNEKQ